MKLTDITKESTEAEVNQAIADNIAEKFANASDGPSIAISGHVDHNSMAPDQSEAFTGMIKFAITDIDKMTDDEVKSELDRRGIDSELSYWKHRCRIFEVLNRSTDGDLRDQMEITGRKEMELTKLRGKMRRMEQEIERLQGIISSAIV